MKKNFAQCLVSLLCLMLLASGTGKASKTSRLCPKFPKQFESSIFKTEIQKSLQKLQKTWSLSESKLVIPQESSRANAIKVVIHKANLDPTTNTLTCTYQLRPSYSPNLGKQQLAPPPGSVPETRTRRRGVGVSSHGSMEITWQPN